MNEIAKCERCREYNAAAVDFRHQATNAQNDYAALLDRHNALVEAVKKYFKSERLEILKRDARAEVDRLIANESAADCKGEG